jgi:hypothetical protein
MMERLGFFYLGKTIHTPQFCPANAQARMNHRSCLRYHFFGGAAAFLLGAAAFGAAAGFLRTGAAFGCAAARLLRAGFAAAFRDAFGLLVEGARRAADAAVVAVALLLLLLLLDDPAAAVTEAKRFRPCVGLPSSSLQL